MKPSKKPSKRAAHGSSANKEGQLGLRVPCEWLDRLDAVAKEIAPNAPGLLVSRSAAARAALLRGLEAFEAELEHAKS